MKNQIINHVTTITPVSNSKSFSAEQLNKEVQKVLHLIKMNSIKHKLNFLIDIV